MILMVKRFVCPRGQIPANGMVQCETGDGVKLLVANAGDDYFAYQAMCPHLEVPHQMVRVRRGFGAGKRAKKEAARASCPDRL